MSPAVVMFMLKELVENDSDHQDLLENIDWYNFPLHYNTISRSQHFSLCEGIFFLWSTLTVTSILRPTTDFGERLEVQMVTIALELMPTETLAINGGLEVIINQKKFRKTS